MTYKKYTCIQSCIRTYTKYVCACIQNLYIQTLYKTKKYITYIKFVYIYIKKNITYIKFIYVRIQLKIEKNQKYRKEINKTEKNLKKGEKPEPAWHLRPLPATPFHRRPLLARHEAAPCRRGGAWISAYYRFRFGSSYCYCRWWWWNRGVVIRLRFKSYSITYKLIRFNGN